MRRIARLVVVLVVGCLAVAAGTAAPAWAHNELISTTPTDQAKLATAPEAVKLTFNDAVGRRFGFVSVTGPDGKQWNEGALQVEGSSVTQPLRELGPAGKYSVSWRVVSADGHPISGTLSFALTKAGGGSAVTTPPPEATPTPTAEGSTTPSASVAAPAPTSGGGTSWPMMAAGLVLGALVLVGLLLGGATLVRRRKATGVS